MYHFLYVYCAVQPRNSETSKKFIKYRLDNFAMGNIRLYIYLSNGRIIKKWT